MEVSNHLPLMNMRSCDEDTVDSDVDEDVGVRGVESDIDVLLVIEY